MRGVFTRVSLILAAISTIAATTGCSRLVVESQPAGAVVLWSADGVDYRPWPPNSWEVRTPTTGGVPSSEGRSRRAPSATPMRTSGIFGDTVFITVEKEGYRTPLPQPVQLFGWRSEKVAFELEELPERTAERMRSMGYLLYRGEWVDPEVADVEDFDGVVMRREQAFRLRQLAAGLVEYDGDWMTPEAAKAAEERDMLALGRVRLKGRWVTPEVYDYEVQIDAQVEEIKATKVYPDLTPPRILERTTLTAAEVQLTNSTGQQVVFLFSGPNSRSFTLPPYQSAGFRAGERIALPPGTYDIVAIPTGRDASGRNLEEVLGSSVNVDAVALRRDPAWAEWPLASGTRYSFNFGSSEEEVRGGLDFNVPDPELRIEAPQLEIPERRIPQRQPRGQGAPGQFPGGQGGQGGQGGAGRAPGAGGGGAGGGGGAR